MDEVRSTDDIPANPSGPPPAPEGYAEPYAFGYPRAVLLIGSMVLGMLSMAIFGGSLWLVQGPEVFSTAFEATTENGTTTFVLDVRAVALPFVAAIVGTTVLHELIHGAVFGQYGHDVSYGAVPSIGAFYAGAFGQFQTRESLFRVGLAPLVVITLVCVPLLAVPIPAVAITAVFVLTLNSAGAVGDLYLTWRLLRMPPKTLMYDVDIHHSYVYESLEA